MSDILSIPCTLQVVVKYWEQAETVLRSLVHRKYHNLNEETITKLFHDEFRFLLKRASEAREISRAFLEDLKRAYPELAYCGELQTISEDLVADVSLHSRRAEGKTGGDFGFTISRPQVSVLGLSTMNSIITSFSESEYPLLVTADRQFGLLTQAKLRDQNGKWGGFTRSQKKRLPDRMSYLALLLYYYNDESRRELAPFQWQVCRDWTIADANRWLKSDTFPSPILASELINLLGEGIIGTDDENVLGQHIRPTGKPQFNVLISWPVGKRPPGEFPVYSYIRTTENISQKQVIYATN
jgi:hypothetical protein